MARVRGGVGACVAEVDEVAFLKVGRQRLIAQHDVDRITGWPAHRPGDVRAGAVGTDAVFEALGSLDDAAEKTCVPVHPALAGARRRAEHAAHEVAGVGHEVAARLGDDLDVLGKGLEALVHHLADHLDRRDGLHVAHGVAAADVEQARLEPGLRHGVEQGARLLERDAPVLGVAALRADVEGHAREVGPQFCGHGHDLPRVGGAGAELAGERPVAADVRGGDAQVLPGVGLDLVDPAQLVDAVDDEPFHALRRGVRNRLARLDRVGEEHLSRGHAEAEQDVKLRRGGDLEARALLGQHLEHAPVRVRLDRVVRPHPRHGRAEAPDLAAHDGRVDDQEGPIVFLPCCLADDLEVEADFGMRVEELFLRLLLWKRAIARDDTAIPHQSSPGVELGFRNVPNAHFVRHDASLGASHDDLLLLAESKRKKT